MSWLVGVDEAGRGPVAGELVVTAFAYQQLGEALPDTRSFRDSKKLSEKRREQIYEEVILPLVGTGNAVFQTVVIPACVIDDVGIQAAWEEAIFESVRRCAFTSCWDIESVIVDGSRLPCYDSSASLSADILTRCGRAVVGADNLIWYVSAASIVAKVQHDRIMRDIWHLRYPEYGFDKHKGYGTAQHTQAILTHGLVPGLHRRKFVPREVRGVAVWRTSGEEGVFNDYDVVERPAG